MDGYTSLASRAADLAYAKGMIVVCSAGNSGDEDWKYIGAPADAYDVISIGATDPYNNKSFFSSYGPTADGRIKPEVAAMGQEISVASVFSDAVYPSNGTSFSSPLVAGMVACLWQALPDADNSTIKKLITQEASQSSHPDNRLGYGTPDFFASLYQHQSKNNIFYYKNQSDIAVQELRLVHLLSKKTENIKIENNKKAILELRLNQTEKARNDWYYLQYLSDDEIIHQELIWLN